MTNKHAIMAYIRTTVGSRTGRNLCYSALLTGANYMFPLAVYTYVSRVLGASGTGLVGFVDSVTTCFILFSMMGVSVLGMRAVARSRGDSRRLSTEFWSLLSLHALFTLVVLAAMALATWLSPTLWVTRQMMGVGMCKLVFNVFLVEWLFTGLERFRFVALRTLAVKGAYVLSVFLFVRTAGDTMTYYVLTMLVVVVMAAVNMGYAVRWVGWHGVRLRLGHLVRPFFAFGVYAVVTASYATLSMALLGFMADDADVGCFSTASKIVALVGVVFGAYLAVISPRATRMLAEGRVADYKQLQRLSLTGVGAVGVGLTVAVYLLAPWMVGIISGPGFEGAVTPLRIMSPLLLVMGLGQTVVMTGLVPRGGERQVAVSGAVGLVTCLVLNLTLTPAWGGAGSAISWLAAEAVSLTLSATFLARRYTFRRE